MKSSTTAQRLRQIMDARDLKQVDILSAAKPYCEKYKVKLGKNDLSQYLSGKVTPGQDKLTILGLALNISEAWLMGYDVTPERYIAPAAVIGDRRMQEYIELFELLSDDQKSFIIHAIKGILSDQ